MSVDHYENFPVASLLLPRHIRQDVVHVYWFARTADDIADEGTACATQRLAQLGVYRKALSQIARTGRIENPDPHIQAIFEPLAESIERHNLPIDRLDALLQAFEQDVTTVRYRNVQELHAYCERSANPVGRLMLQMFGEARQPMTDWSDAICTALQRINFLQDVAIDWDKGRVYLPQDAMAATGVTETQIADQIVDDHWRRLMRDQVRQCRALLDFGRPLGKHLRGRVGLEIRLIVEGGNRILDKLEAVDFDVFRKRPVLTRRDWITMLWRSLR